MTDYTSLVTALREEAEAVKAIEWDIPICTSNYILEAADAIEQLVKERDAAVEDLKLSALRGIIVCRLCKNIKLCDDVNFPCKWEWRGAQPKEEDDGQSIL